MNWVVPPASMVMLAFAWPALSFLRACEWLYSTYYSEDMEDKVVIITGASSGIGEVRKTEKLLRIVMPSRERERECLLTQR